MVKKDKGIDFRGADINPENIKMICLFEEIEKIANRTNVGNFKMNQVRKAGRPREWVLNEEIVEIHRLITELKMQNPKAHWSDIKRLLKIQLEQGERKDLLSKFDKLWGLSKQVIPFPPRCICGRRIYSYTYRVEKGNEHSWEILARCVNPNCRYERRYLPSAITYKWSRPKPAFSKLPPTNYEMDGQLVEKPK